MYLNVNKFIKKENERVDWTTALSNTYDSGCIYFIFIIDELNFCGDYSVWCSSNNSPGDLSVSWKVEI